MLRLSVVQLLLKIFAAEMLDQKNIISLCCYLIDRVPRIQGALSQDIEQDVHLCAATCPIALDFTSLFERASVLPHVPRLAEPRYPSLAT
jgi:hypothetical protein